MSDHVVEIKPRPLPSPGQNSSHSKDEFVAEIWSKSRRPTLPLQSPDLGLSFNASDSDVQKILSERKFSQDGLIHLLERSLVTLIEKLLTGRNIYKIEGAVGVSFYGSERQIIVNLRKQFPDNSDSPQAEHFLLAKLQPGNVLLKNCQPEHELLENCLNVKVKARETAPPMHYGCPGISSSPGCEFDRDPCHSPTETDCGLAASCGSQDERPRSVLKCTPSSHFPSPVNDCNPCSHSPSPVNNFPSSSHSSFPVNNCTSSSHSPCPVNNFPSSIQTSSPVNNFPSSIQTPSPVNNCCFNMAQDTYIPRITQKASCASSTPAPEGEDNEVHYKESDVESGYLSNEKEDSDIPSDQSKGENNKCNDKSIDDYNDYFCNGFDSPSTRYLDSPASGASCCQLNADSRGSSAEGSDEMEEDSDDDCEHRLMIDESALNESTTTNIADRFEKDGHKENCCWASERITPVNNFLAVTPIQNMNEEEGEKSVSVNSEVKEPTLLDIVDTKANEKPHGNSGFNWKDVPGMVNPQSEVPDHLRQFLNKGDPPVGAPQGCNTPEFLNVPSEHDLHACRTFTAKNNHKGHIRRQKPYPCNNCPQPFIHNEDLKGQLIRHEFSNLFRCSLCQKMFPDRAGVKNHMVREHGSRLMHVCPQCGESFGSEDAFTCHKETHPELKQFACKTCNFIGTDSMMLLKHNLLHSHKLFSCKPCNAFFADPFQYTTHLRKHKKMTSFTQYVCCFCDTVLQSYEQMVTHENTHAQSKTHACKVCRKQFRSKMILNDHLTTHHQPVQPQSENNLSKPVEMKKTQLDGEQANFLHTDVNVQPKPIDYSKERSEYPIEETAAGATQMECDEFYGQLLDLSMKKSPSLKLEKETSSSGKNQTECFNTSVTATGTSVNDGSRNGTSSSDPARLSQECRFRQPGFEPDHLLKAALLGNNSFQLMVNKFPNVARSEEFAVYGNQFSPSSNDKHTPLTKTIGSHAFSEPLVTRRSNHAERAKHVLGLSNDAIHKHILSRSTCNQPRGRQPLFFSPYSREKMADLAAKFMLARGNKLIGERGKVKLLVSSREGKKVGGISPQFAARKQGSNLEKAAEAVPMETEGSRKDAVLDLTGQAHQENGTVVSEYSNMETSLRCHIPTVVKSEPLKEQDANAGSPLDFRYRTPKTDGADIGSLPAGCQSCDICRETFGTFLELEEHSVEVHKRYLCEHCKKGFTARPNRDRHVRYHTGERPYKCDLCDLAFFRGDDLKYHRTTRHPTAQPFVCPRCSANFTWGRDLEKHIRHSRCKV